MVGGFAREGEVGDGGGAFGGDALFFLGLLVLGGEVLGEGTAAGMVDRVVVLVGAVLVAAVVGAVEVHLAVEDWGCRFGEGGGVEGLGRDEGLWVTDVLLLDGLLLPAFHQLPDVRLGFPVRVQTRQGR